MCDDDARYAELPERASFFAEVICGVVAKGAWRREETELPPESPEPPALAGMPAAAARALKQDGTLTSEQLIEMTTPIECAIPPFVPRATPPAAHLASGEAPFCGHVSGRLKGIGGAGEEGTEVSRAPIVDVAAANDSQGTTDGSARAARPCIASATTSGDPISGSELGAAMATALALVRSAASSAAAGPATSHELEPSGRHIPHQEAPERRERQPNPVELRYARLEAESRGLQWYSRPRGAAPYSEAAGTRGRRKVWNYLTGVFDDPPPLLATDDEQVSRLPHELRPSAPMMGPSERSLLQEALPPAVGLATPPAEEWTMPQAKPVPQFGEEPMPQAGEDLVPQAGEDLVPQAGEELVPQAGEDLVPQAGEDLVPAEVEVAMAETREAAVPNALPSTDKEYVGGAGLPPT